MRSSRGSSAGAQASEAETDAMTKPSSSSSSSSAADPRFDSGGCAHRRQGQPHLRCDKRDDGNDDGGGRLLFQPVRTLAGQRFGRARPTVA